MRAFVIGNAALDETLLVAAMPAPGASVHGNGLSHDLGGKAVNQAVVLARAGILCRLVAAVGDDARGAEISTLLAREPVEARLLVQAGIASDRSLILMAQGGENVVVTTTAAADALDPVQALAAMADARNGDLVVVQGNLSGETTAAVLHAARAHGTRTAVNPSPLRGFFADLWPLIDMLFVNEGEADALAGPAALHRAGVGQVVLTRGAAGAVLSGAAFGGMGRGENGRGGAGASVVVPAHPCEVVDTTGAGDCFMAAALASMLLRGTPLDAAALMHGARAAALTVSRPGTVSAFPSAAELAAILAIR